MDNSQTAADKGIEQIRRATSAGVSLNGAVQDVLDRRESSLRKMAMERQVNRSALNSALTGSRHASEREVAALCEEFGGEAAEWRELLADAMRRRLDDNLKAAANQ